MRRTLFLWTVLWIALSLMFSGCGGGESGEEGPAELKFNVDPVGKAYEVNQQLAGKYEQKTGTPVKLIKGPTDATERLSQYLLYFSAGSGDIDLYQVDVIWPGILSEHLVDLSPVMTEEELSDFFPAIVENNTINGKLAAIPWFGDAGIFYYRTDLLEKYGYDAPPETWDEMEKMAKKIQQGERDAGNPDFWGFVFQGKAYEALTCNGLEWIASHGGGSIVEPDGSISINNPNAVKAIERAASWVGEISPPGVTTYQEEEARRLFQAGNAAFMRNWPYAYKLGHSDDSSIKGKFDVTVLPKGENGKHAAALGGWQVGVSDYTQNREEAFKLAKWFTSEEAQKRRASEAGMLPTRVSLYDDPLIIEQVPIMPTMKTVFQNAVPRPSTVTGDKYNEVSSIFFQNVNQALTGTKTAEEAIQDIEEELKDLL